MTPEEIQAQLFALKASEKAEVIQKLTQMLDIGAKGITKISGVCGGDACIHGTRLPVWLLVSLRSQGANDAELLALYPHLSAGDLVNAWAYADAYAEEIETALREEAEV